jgi:ceramide glucosyltransferase
LDHFFTKAADWASVICYAAAAVGCVYALFAAWAARGFVRSSTTASVTNYPAVTILKPLSGIEPTLYANLAGFCVQDYPSPVQIVFGVDDPADPAIAIVRKLIADFPGCDLKLAINSRRHGTNRKVSNLINMLCEAQHEVLVISDSDIVVDLNYLKGIAASIEKPGVGLVTCLYRGAAAAGLWSRLTAAAIDYHFLPNVLVGLKLGLAAPCFGSTIALRRKTLAMIGGFEAVVDQLADDYALGELVRWTGLTVAIPSSTVAHVCADRSAGDLLRHELRWARTIRSVDPLGFAGLAITHALPLALLGMVLGGITPASIIVIAALACRFALQAALDRVFHLRDDIFWLGPLRDLLSFGVFVASFFRRGVEWRGHRYGVAADNRLAYYGEVES